MAETNAQVYPITAKFEEVMEFAIGETYRETNFDHAYSEVEVRKIFSDMASNIGEYEHGSADWPGGVQVYADVCSDIIRTFISI